VLTTRARQRMRVFSSMRGEEISAAGTTAAGAKLLREFLLYAEHGRLESVMASAAAATESPFERDVLTELTRRGLTVIPQVGCAGYRIDFGILDEDAPGRFLCGIECDGVAYHASETTRDRDRLRQQVLEARGWTIHRVWSTDWFKDRAGQIERLTSLIEQSRVRAREEAAAEREARARAAADAARAAELAAAAAAAPPSRARGAVYERPTVPPYQFTDGEGCYAGTDLLGAPTSQLLQAITAVVDAEAPIHLSDLTARVAGMWRTRVGARIAARITDTCQAAERDGLLRCRDGFVWRPDETCLVRSRAGTRIPAERIAPEEYHAAVLLVLRSGFGFARDDLINEVRAVFGYSRTGPQLEAAIGSAIDRLLAHGTVGEGAAGIQLRG
jgi:very-short-patch-repair endonuclease